MIRKLHYILLLFIGFNASASTFNNRIFGKIVDIETQEPLVLTNVFLANTTRGTATDKYGEFEFNDIQPGIYQLVISQIGYELKVIDCKIAPNISKEYNIELIIKPLTGQEIEVVAEHPEKWEILLKKFHKIFLGETKNAKKCTILNPEVLSFQYDKTTGDFLAQASMPIIVENRALGYLSDIILKDFRWCISGDGHFTYYPFYKEMTPLSTSEEKAWQKNRQKTFEGSFQHFLKSWALGNVCKNGFSRIEFYTPDRDELKFEKKLEDPDSLALSKIHQKPQIFRYNFSTYVKVYYKRKSSFIIPHGSYMEFNEFGHILTPHNFKVSGYWAKFRIADKLPYDYRLE